MSTLIQHPPLWIISIIGAILVSHALHAAFKFATHKKLKSDTFIITLEILVTSVCLYVTLHAYLDSQAHTSTVNAWFNSPILVLGVTILWVFLSMIVYVAQRFLGR